MVLKARHLAYIHHLRDVVWTVRFPEIPWVKGDGVRCAGLLYDRIAPRFFRQHGGPIQMLVVLPPEEAVERQNLPGPRYIPQCLVMEAKLVVNDVAANTHP